MIDLRRGDCLELLKGLPDNSVDAVVTDPPAGIEFMGQAWDSDKGGRDAWIAWLRDVMVECVRVLKPGGYALVWALPRTSHWTAMAVEDAGFEIRDVVTHLFGTGFPKSLNVSKAIDAQVLTGGSHSSNLKRANALRPGEGRQTATLPNNGVMSPDRRGGFTNDAPATDDAARWQGWGTALKPASEHWILARKPLDGTVAANVLKYGTGALNIDGCRIDVNGERLAIEGRGDKSLDDGSVYGSGLHGSRCVGVTTLGRWPSNLTLDEEAAAALDEQSGERPSGGVNGRRSGAPSVAKGAERPREYINGRTADSGGASRFFYVAKASKADKTANGTVENIHPTVKNTSLMRWLVRLITPPGGTVLDPFMGSGSTGVACVEEGFSFVGMEREENFFEIARKRIRYATLPVDQIQEKEED